MAWSIKLDLSQHRPEWHISLGNRIKKLTSSEYQSLWPLKRRNHLHRRLGKSRTIQDF
jgi:hypothetical protein